MKMATVTAEFDDLIRRCKVVSNGGNESKFLEFLECTDAYHRNTIGLEEEVCRLQSELVKSKSENNGLQMKLKNARQLLDIEKGRRLAIEKDKSDLESQVAMVVEMLGRGNINETKEKLQILSSTLSGLGCGNEVMKQSLREIMSPNHLSTINEDADTMGSILNVSDIDLTEGDELELSKTRSGKVFTISPQNKSGNKRKSSPMKINYPDNKRAAISYEENKENNGIVYDKGNLGKAVGRHSGGKHLPSAPPISSDDNSGAEGKALISFNENPYSTPLRHIQQVPSKPLVVGVTPGNGTLYSSPGNSPLLRNYSSSTMNGRPHCFISKTIYWTDFCHPCGKRIKFGRSAFKCRECRATCHSECKEALPLPCVPTVSTPGNKGQLGAIVDYTPRIPPMVPAIIIYCTNEVENRGLNEVGIYRVPGSEREVKELKDRFLRGKGPPNISQVDIHVICGTMKDFLRSLKEPLITHTLWRDFVNATEKPEPQDSLAALYQAISDLPQPNRDTLAWIMCHLQRVAECVECKMPITNLAKVFGPTIIGYSVSEPQPCTILEETKQQQKAMEKLLEISNDYWKTFINVSEDSISHWSKLNTPEKSSHAGFTSSSTRRRSILSRTPMPPRESDTPIIIRSRK